MGDETMVDMFHPQFVNGRVRAVNLKSSECVVGGRDFFGRKAWLRFVRTENYGWFQDTGNICERFWNIHPKQVVAKSRRLCLVDDEEKIWMNYPEHITALRILGLDRVAISCGPGKWPPYLLAGELILKLNPFLEYSNYQLDWMGINHSKKCNFNEFSRCTNVEYYQRGILLDCSVDYANGYIHKTGEFLYGDNNEGDCVNQPVLASLLLSPTQGWPKRLYYLSSLADFFGWPHHHRVCWPQKYAKKHTHIVEAAFLNHRFLDLFGVIGAKSLIGKKLLSCSIISYRGGHSSGIKALTDVM